MGVDFVRRRSPPVTRWSPQAAAPMRSRRRSARGQRPDNLLVVRLDITNPADAEAAVQAAVERFGRIDVLINNAASFQAGFFEEVSSEQFRAQIEVNFFGALNVTRAVLPVMRRQRSGQVVTISSTAGWSPGSSRPRYAASKFALEGWMEALRPEVAPYGITTTIVEPGFFRTKLLEKESTILPALSIPDYAERTAQILPFWEEMNGKQSGDPAKLARALVSLLGLARAARTLGRGCRRRPRGHAEGRTAAPAGQCLPELSTTLDHEPES